MKTLVVSLWLLCLPVMALGYQTTYNPFTQKPDYVGAGANLVIPGGLNFSSLNSISGSYTATSTDTVISASASGGAVTVTLDAASTKKGQLLSITKTDTSANAVTVKTAGSDTINASTGTFILNAAGQTLQIISDGTSLWLASILQATPPYVGYKDAPSAAQSVTASSSTQLVATEIRTPVRMTGIRFVDAATVTGSMQVGLYDKYGILIASSAETLCPAAAANTLSFTTAVNVQPGIYYLAIGADNTSVTFPKSSGNSNIGCNTFVANLPMANVTLSGSSTLNCFALTGIVSGGVTQ